MNIPDDIPRTYKEFDIEIMKGTRGQQYGAEGIRPTGRRHIAVSAVYHSPLAAWLALQHLIDVTGSTRVDERSQVLLSALCLAGQVVRQHNLLSTASEQERLATLARHVEWWNYVAVPAIETVLGPGSRREILTEAARAAVRVPDFLDVPPWLAAATAPAAALQDHPLRASRSGSIRMMRPSRVGCRFHDVAVYGPEGHLVGTYSANRLDQVARMAFAASDQNRLLLRYPDREKIDERVPMRQRGIVLSCIVTKDDDGNFLGDYSGTLEEIADQALFTLGGAAANGLWLEIHRSHFATSAETPIPGTAPLQKLAEQLGLASQDLDEAVDDAAWHIGHNVNNQGLDRQIQFLAEQLGEKDAEEEIRAAALGKQNADQDDEE